MQKIPLQSVTKAAAVEDQACEVGEDVAPPREDGGEIAPSIDRRQVPLLILILSGCTKVS